MTHKEMEGGNRQRRGKARQARRRGRLASEAGVTLGASKQRYHLDRDEPYEEKLTAKRRGKQEVIEQRTPRSPRPTGQGR